MLLTLESTADGTLRTVLSTTLTLDSDGTAELCDMATLLSDWLTDGTPATLTVSVSGTPSTCTVLPCRTTAGLTAAEWVTRRALTLCRTLRHTCYAATEHLTAYAASPLATVLFTFADGSQLTRPLKSSGTDASGLLCYYDLKWSAWKAYFPDGCRDTFQAEVTIGTLEPITFCSIAAPYGAEAVEFRNAFGQWETIVFASVAAKHKPTRSAVMVNGQYVNYLAENATTWEGVSLTLTDGELDMAADFLESLQLRRQSDSATIALTDGELDADSLPDAMPRLKATWREAERMPRRGQTSQHIFDGSFDETYS